MALKVFIIVTRDFLKLYFVDNKLVTCFTNAEKMRSISVLNTNGMFFFKAQLCYAALFLLNRYRKFSDLMIKGL